MSDHGLTYQSVITSVRSKLHCGAERISAAPVAWRWSWWPSEPDLHDELLSDYGMGTPFADLEMEFREEIDAIRKTLDELADTPEPDGLGEDPAGAEHRLAGSLSQVSQAMSIWEQIGVPIRRRGDVVFRIWAPRDVMGSPVVKGLPVDTFLSCVAEQTASERVKFERLRASMEKWRIATIMLVILMAGALGTRLFL